MSEKTNASHFKTDDWLGKEHWLSRILDDAGAGIFFLDQNGRFIRTNAAMCNRLLYDPGDLENRYSLDLLYQKDADDMKEILHEMVAGKRSAYRRQIRYQREDGSIFWGDMSLALIQSKEKKFETIIGIVIDINEQKLAEEKLRTSEERYRRVFNKSGAASIIIEPDMTISMANEEFEKLTGYYTHEIEHHMKWSAFVVPEDLEKMSHYHQQRRIQDGQAPDEYECSIINRSGEVRDIFIKVGMLPDGIRSIASFMDITSLKKTTRALKDSEAKLLAIIEAAEGLIYTCNQDFIIEFMNKALIDQIGKDATGSLCYQSLYQRDSQCPWCAWQDVFNGNADRKEFESPVDHRWYDAMMSPIFDDTGAVSRFEAFVIDITERKLAEKALREREVYLRRENVRLKSSIRDRFRFGNIIGKSQVMQQVYELILNAAATDANVIIYGESGTGKELVAQAVHNMSERSKSAFVVVNCGAIPENLLESEFFGYKKGAFTGAEQNKHGYLDLADSGTLFMDELGEIGLNMQVKLLRVIEGMGYRPVGSDQMHHPDIRIIAASNRDLAELVRNGKMREDFYYRIHVIPIHLPPLRDRKEDLPLLIDHFMKRYGDRDRLPPITGEIIDVAQAYDWPGNVRELQNVLHRYMTFNRFDLSEMSLKKESVGKKKHTDSVIDSALVVVSPKSTLPESVEAYEKQMILKVLEKNLWHRGKAAEDLGINRRTLFKKIKKYRLDRS
ncbi:MAG: sigma 54-interacting transcriptional regulator [Desulfobacteraceae bacterium]|nr:sigma 54-interacting transcriptional regulator [Desulfobacteraceae bacterium]MBC2754869.1 sigma 54-interacting transcriptional regulator [Desulfobacteraceae bacterium]